MDCEELFSFLSKYEVPGSRESVQNFQGSLEQMFSSGPLSGSSESFQNLKGDMGEAVYPYLWMKLSEKFGEVFVVTAIESTNNPAALNELGYLLLRRCRFDSLPISELDYENGLLLLEEWEEIEPDTLFLWREDNDGPEFPDKRLGIDLAIRAFGRAWFEYCHNAEKYEGHDTWRAYFTLDGLRVVLMELRELEVLENLQRSYQDWIKDLKWLEYYEVFDTPVGIQLNFRELKGYIAGWQESTAVITVENLHAPLQTLELQREVLSKLQELPTREELLQVIRPLQDNAAIEQDFKLRYGEQWNLLPQPVQDLLVSAEGSYIREKGRNTDYWSLIVAYFKPLEWFIKEFAEYLDQSLGYRSYSREKASDLLRLYSEQKFMDLARRRGLKRTERLMQLVPQLREPNRIRGPRPHAARDIKPTSLREAARYRLQVLGGSTPADGLLWKLAEALHAQKSG